MAFLRFLRLKKAFLSITSGLGPLRGHNTANHTLSYKMEVSVCVCIGHAIVRERKVAET